MRLIDADELERLFNAQVKQGATDLVAAFADALQDAQTVGTIPAVRCKECQHCMREANYSPAFVCVLWGGRRLVNPDGYCDCGKRKSE